MTNIFWGKAGWRVYSVYLKGSRLVFDSGTVSIDLEQIHRNNSTLASCKHTPCRCTEKSVYLSKRGKIRSIWPRCGVLTDSIESAYLRGKDTSWIAPWRTPYMTAIQQHQCAGSSIYIIWAVQNTKSVIGRQRGIIDPCGVSLIHIEHCSTVSGSVEYVTELCKSIHDS